jgi:hypothetical protein
VVPRKSNQSTPSNNKQGQEKESKGKTTDTVERSWPDPLQKPFHPSNATKNKTRNIKAKKEIDY